MGGLSRICYWTISNGVKQADDLGLCSWGMNPGLGVSLACIPWHTYLAYGVDLAAFPVCLSYRVYSSVWSWTSETSIIPARIRSELAEGESFGALIMATLHLH